MVISGNLVVTSGNCAADRTLRAVHDLFVVSNTRSDYERRMDRDLARAIERLGEGDMGGARTALEPLFARAKTSTKARDHVLESILEVVDHPDAQVAATIATVAGALVEQGAAPRPLARAVLAPFRRTLDQAKLFVDRAALLPEAEDGDDNSVEVCRRIVSRAAFEALANEHPKGAAALAALDRWYLAVAAGWTRDTATLRELQGDLVLRERVEAVASEGGIIWIANLLSVPFEAPLVVVFPELNEAWSVRMSGVADMGQLSVLLSHALADPLGRLGAAPADALVLACMSGEGPQQTPASYESAFHLYPWEALDLASGLPKPGLFQWSALGGVGDHSLPADFWPGALEPVAEGVRVLLAVGLDAPGSMRFTRVISGARAFSGLRACVDGTRRLSSTAATSCVDAVRMRVELLRRRALT